MVYIKDKIVINEYEINTGSQKALISETLGDECIFKYDDEGNVLETKKFNVDTGDWEVI